MTTTLGPAWTPTFRTRSLVCGEEAIPACMARAARTACAGSVNEAITASPIVLTTAPSWSRTIAASSMKCARTRL
ncbi:Uncharacterised protein [Mycobacterium tuberculosis]|nr:Uncharacterised protein [Mycobacterium tuberculosis]